MRLNALALSPWTGWKCGMRKVVLSQNLSVFSRALGACVYALAAVLWAASAAAGGLSASMVHTPAAQGCSVFMTEAECRGHLETLARLRGADLLTYLAVTEAAMRERAWLCGGGRHYLRLAGLPHR